MSEKIVIVGFGRVGQANGIALRIMGNAVFFYDPNPVEFIYADVYAAVYARIPKLPEVSAEDSDHTTYLVCVSDSLLTDGSQDTTAIHSSLEKLQNTKGTVVLRSTVLPDRLAGFPRFDFYLPEFLHEKQAVGQSMRPVRLVIGTNSQKPHPQFLAAWIRSAEHVFFGSPSEAAQVKYLANIWNAVRISFVNEMGAVIADNSTLDIQRVSKILSFILGDKDYQRFGRAFGGRCLPKDLIAYVRAVEKLGHTMLIAEAAARANELHQNKSNHECLPQWSSES